MTPRYGRTLRPSIYHPASFGDIPPEILGLEIFIYLDTGTPHQGRLLDLSLVCSAWYHVVQRMMISESFVFDDKKLLKLASGMILREIVGCDTFSIRNLTLDINDIGKERATILAPLVSHSLASLHLEYEDYGEEDRSSEFVVLESFFIHCPWIRNLKIFGFHFGDTSSSMSQSIKDGFIRLRQLSIFACRGNLAAFIGQIDIPNLRYLDIDLYFEYIGMDDILDAVALNYRSLTSIVISAAIDSPSCLLKIVECLSRSRNS